MMERSAKRMEAIVKREQQLETVKTALEEKCYRWQAVL